MMTKLYKRLPDGSLAYHEAWTDENEITEHWGRVGTTGESKEHPLSKRSKRHEELARILAPAREDGFREIAEEDHATLLVEFIVPGARSDLKKRVRLEDRLNELLGWQGLGHCDGGSIGSATMEVCCLVVDFETAKRVIEKDLAGTEFADFSRIFDEKVGEGSPLTRPGSADRKGSA
jgi:predicted DNA-binding WGR domain protein